MHFLNYKRCKVLFTHFDNQAKGASEVLIKESSNVRYVLSNTVLQYIKYGLIKGWCVVNSEVSFR